jgi:acetyl-CoA carboxylase carboxyltransferase component
LSSATIICGWAKPNPRAHPARKARPNFANARLWDGGIIAPSDTRHVLSLELSACPNAPVGETKFGVFRMIGCETVRHRGAVATQ